MFTFYAHKETILVYAWLTSLEYLRSAVRLKGKEPWERQNREKIVTQLLETEVAKVDAASFYGGLLRYGSEQVDADTIRAILDESGGIYFKEETLDDEEQQQEHEQRVTALLLQSIEQDGHLRYNLELLCQTLIGEDLVVSASALRDFFLLHACLCLRDPNLALFIPGVVCVQLERVRWIEVVARMLVCKVPDMRLPLQEVSRYAHHEGVLAALLEEAVWQSANVLGAFSTTQQIPTALCEQVETLSKACRDLAHSLSMQRTLAVYETPRGQEGS